MIKHRNIPEFRIDFNTGDILDINSDLKSELLDFKNEISIKLSELMQIIASSPKGEEENKPEPGQSQKELVKLAKSYFDIAITSKLIKENPELSKSYVSSILFQLTEMKNYLTNNKVEVIDHTGKKYNEKYNYDVLESIDKEIDPPTIIETVEPEIRVDGKVVEQAKIIIEINKK